MKIKEKPCTVSQFLKIAFFFILIMHLYFMCSISILESIRIVISLLCLYKYTLYCLV